MSLASNVCYAITTYIQYCTQCTVQYLVLRWPNTVVPTLLDRCRTFVDKIVLPHRNCFLLYCTEVALSMQKTCAPVQNDRSRSSMQNQGLRQNLQYAPVQYTVCTILYCTVQSRGDKRRFFHTMLLRTMQFFRITNLDMIR